MLYLLIFLITISDQLIKLYIENNFIYGESIAIIHNIFHITYVKNTGAAFGILKGKTTFFIIISAVIILFLLIYRYYLERSSLLDMSFALIIGGAIGNLIDRVRLNYVVDYLDFRIWPVFNLADSAVVIGAIIFVIYIIFLEDNIDK